MTTTKASLTASIEDAIVLLGSLRGLEPQVERAAEVIAGALTTGRKLLTLGNGGSAADAAHLATEFVCRFNRDRRPYPAICLATSGGDLTAIGNDYAFDQVFERQVKAFANRGDVVVAISSTGNSNNALLALSAARAQGATTIALLGRNGGAMRGRADVELLVGGTVTARIQEAQKLLIHVLCELVEERLAAPAAADGGGQ